VIKNGLAVALFTVTETESSVIADNCQRRAVSLRTAWLLYVNNAVAYNRKTVWV